MQGALNAHTPGGVDTLQQFASLGCGVHLEGAC
jgi:hypothetical protein